MKHQTLAGIQSIQDSSHTSIPLTVSGSFSNTSLASSLVHFSSTHSLSRWPCLVSSNTWFALRCLRRNSLASFGDTDTENSRNSQLLLIALVSGHCTGTRARLAYLRCEEQPTHSRTKQQIHTNSLMFGSASNFRSFWIRILHWSVTFKAEHKRVCSTFSPVLSHFLSLSLSLALIVSGRFVGLLVKVAVRREFPMQTFPLQ